MNIRYRYRLVTPPVWILSKNASKVSNCVKLVDSLILKIQRQVLNSKLSFNRLPPTVAKVGSCCPTTVIRLNKLKTPPVVAPPNKLKKKSCACLEPVLGGLVSPGRSDTGPVSNVGRYELQPP